MQTKVSQVGAWADSCNAVQVGNGIEGQVQGRKLRAAEARLQAHDLIVLQQEVL